MSEYELAKSIKALGKLTPILKDAHGNIIDGLHRLEQNPNWPSITITEIDTPEKLEAARLACNTNRRIVEPGELRFRIGLLCKAGLSVEQISNMTGLSERTIYRYKPEELKPTGEAIKTGMTDVVSRNSQLPPVSSLPKTQDLSHIRQERHESPTAGLVECEHCHVNVSSTVDWNGHQLCERCNVVAIANPAYYKRFFELRNQVDKVVKSEPRTPSIETPEHRVAVMHPQSSAMEEKIVMRLRAKGLNIWTDEVLCVEGTKPDFNIQLPSGKIARGYDDGPVHSPRRRDRDEYLRGQWLKHHPNEIVVSVDSVGDSDGEADEKTGEIMKKLGLEENKST